MVQINKIYTYYEVTSEGLTARIEVRDDKIKFQNLGDVIGREISPEQCRTLSEMLLEVSKLIKQGNKVKKIKHGKNKI